MEILKPEKHPVDQGFGYDVHPHPHMFQALSRMHHRWFPRCEGDTDSADITETECGELPGDLTLGGLDLRTVARVSLGLLLGGLLSCM